MIARTSSSRPVWFSGFVVGAIIGSLATGATALIASSGGGGMVGDPSAAVRKKAEYIATMKARYEEMHTLCRGGSGSESLTIDACDAREKIAAEMKKINYCMGSYDPPETPSSDRVMDFYACDTLPPQ